MGALLWLLALSQTGGASGTPAGSLRYPPEPSASCSCHQDYDSVPFRSPGNAYRATAMAIAGRDPLFRAALDVANQDRPDLTELCLRCHTPMGWLAGRSEPGDGSSLRPEDFESVTCDVCHRMVPASELLIGNGQYTIDPATAKHAARGGAPLGGHGVARSDYTGSSELCATCHSLFNPEEQAHDGAGRVLSTVYYEQRTFEEWRDSIFGQQRIECIDCHMPREEGAAAREGPVYPDMHLHRFVGGNTFAVDAVAVLEPQLGLAAGAAAVRRWVMASLQSAVQLEAIGDSASITAAAGSSFDLSLRVTNLTGHKLPTGYPEGRRVYLELAWVSEAGVDFVSGAYDAESGTVVRDAQFVSYETEHGRYEGGRSERTHRLLLMNQVLSDTRIPPEGFVPEHEDMRPSDDRYGTEAPYRHYDEPVYRLNAPTQPGSYTLRVRAMYQETDGEVIRFLVDEATPGSDGQRALSQAEALLGYPAPKEMAAMSVAVRVTEAAPSGTDNDRVADVEGGCACRAEGGPSSGLDHVVFGCLGFAAVFARRRRLRAG